MNEKVMLDIANAAARDVMTAHFTALNARDEAALAATLQFPHYRLSGGRLKIWDGPEAYFSDFLTRAGDGWQYSVLDSVDVMASSPDKVHLDVRFTRYQADDTSLGSFRSLWVIANLDGRWVAQLRSSFAA